jgi:hypothetical protein
MGEETWTADRVRRLMAKAGAASSSRFAIMLNAVAPNGYVSPETVRCWLRGTRPQSHNSITALETLERRLAKKKGR